METKDHIIIAGGGLFGLSAAIVVSEAGYPVTVLEKELDILRGASLVNQNRVHYGYHYPRSINTGREALTGLDSFKAYFGNAVVTGFDKFYAIASTGSHTSVSDFENFCRELNIPLHPQYPDASLLNREMVKACWKVHEPVFDYHVLRQEVMKKLSNLRKVRVLRNASIKKIVRGSTIQITLSNDYLVEGAFLINATYSGLNTILSQADIEPLRAKYQLLVLPILQYDQPHNPFGITIMDGPFCSLVPRGFVKNEFILSHVSRSIVDAHIGYRQPDWNVLELGFEQDVIKEAARFYPVLSTMKLKESWITTKMILPNQEIDDARPTLVMRHTDNIASVFSGKISTCIAAARQVLEFLK